MTPDQFWELSFYEWSLWVLRIRNVQQQREDQKVFWGNWMALYTNVRLKEGVEEVTWEDFYTPAGKQEEHKEKLTPEELQAKMERALKRG